LEALWIFKKTLQKEALLEASERRVKYDKLNDLFNTIARRHYYKTIGKLDVQPMKDGIEQTFGEQDVAIQLLKNDDKYLYDIKKLNQSLAQLPTFFSQNTEGPIREMYELPTAKIFKRGGFGMGRDKQNRVV
jgi:hypothetical protein